MRKELGTRPAGACASSSRLLTAIPFSGKPSDMARLIGLYGIFSIGMGL